MSKRIVAWLVALVVVAALGVGGVVVARTTGSRDRQPPLLRLAPGVASGGQASAPASAGAAPGGPADAGLPGPTYRLPSGLPRLPGEARAWSLRPEATAARVAGLAGALGLRGRPKQSPDGWTLVDGNRYLRVLRAPGTPWSYAGRVTVSCEGLPSGVAGPVEAPAVVGCPAGAAGGFRTPCAPACSGCREPVACRVPPAPPRLPSRAEAERVASGLFARVGLDLSTAAVRVADRYWDWQVTASPQVDGRATAGWSWTASVGPGSRIEVASGWLAVPEPAATYPLIGVEAALERLNQHRVVVAVSPQLRCAKMRTGPPCPPQPAVRRQLTAVRLGLELVPLVTGGPAGAQAASLVPAYLFEFDGNPDAVEPVVAVKDRYLAAPAATQPGPGAPATTR
jgi:hypothetical protein